ncbi:MAG: DUF3040 domain-containing protein [Propionibacteriaceae bacterium]|jgi:hypothetical protein|nr:DUF3040 domain-containing protein [Propionibacteriaceae bacterium]
MALTEAERKLLAELEATLTAQDPKLVSKFTQPPRRVGFAPAVGGAIGFLVGLVGLVVGMGLGPGTLAVVVSVLGFIAMLVSAVFLYSIWTKDSSTRSFSKTSVAASGESFMSRLEQRWQDRQS